MSASTFKRSRSFSHQVKTSWWFLSRFQIRLSMFARSLCKRANLRLTNELSGIGQNQHGDREDLILINPSAFQDVEPVLLQFELTQGVIGHEVGHSLFTDGWVSSQYTKLAWLVNALEDERIERGVAYVYPLFATRFEQLAKFLLTNAPSTFSALDAALIYRWACRFQTDEQFVMSLDSPDEWAAIKPLVLQAWEAPSTEEVIRIAKEILAILKIPTEDSPRRCAENMIGADLPEGKKKGRRIPSRHREAQENSSEQKEDNSTEEGSESSAEGEEEDQQEETDSGPEPRASKSVSTSSASSEDAEEDSEEFVAEDQPINPSALGDMEAEAIQMVEKMPSDTYSHPAPFMDLENEVKLAVAQLSRKLVRPTPEVLTVRHEWRGRYNARAAVQTPDKPFMKRELIGDSSRSLALYVLVDRSGSMSVCEGHVRTALMMLYLAATRNGIPTGIAYFGAQTSKNCVLEITPPSLREEDGVKASIAGYSGATGNEFLCWGLKLAEKRLFELSAPDKVVLVIHDGQPVYSGPEGRDWDLSMVQLSKMRANRLHTIGLYLGCDGKDVIKMTGLFNRNLIVCSPDQLPDELGTILVNLG